MSSREAVISNNGSQGGTGKRITENDVGRRIFLVYSQDKRRLLVKNFYLPIG